MVTENQTILSVKNLVTAFQTEEGLLRAVDGVSFDLPRGSTLGLVGESGCGKSVTALSIMRLLPKPTGQYIGGEILYNGIDILSLPVNKLHQIRGNHISMIFQEPMTALNPVQPLGKQLAEVFELHQPEMKKNQIIEASIDILRKVGIPVPEKRIGEYSHQISGGMRQRVMIAMALACKPDILIADEPTTALDVTIQAQILDLIKSLQKETGMSVIFITHDMGVIAEVCDQVVVMYAGKIAEIAPGLDFFKSPKHPYSQGLLSSIPSLVATRKTQLNVIKGMVPALHQLPKGCRFQNRCSVVMPICKHEIPPLTSIQLSHFVSCHIYDHSKDYQIPSDNTKEILTISEKVQTASGVCLSVKNLKMHFPTHGGIFKRQTGRVYAVDGVSFQINKGETVGLVGESGCGKTTVGRSILRLYEPTAGEVEFENKNIINLPAKDLRALRRNMQMIFQDPFESLNSRHTIGEILEEPFVIHKIGNNGFRRNEVKKLLDKVGLSKTAITRFPHEFSGGQRQRIGIARAIALKPKLIICDEAVSALDVSIQSQILNLLLELQQEMGLTYLFIAHDLSVVKHISDKIAVMYLGKIVEYSDADTVYQKPLHPYTQALISAIPVPDPTFSREKIILQGDVPSPIDPPPGCCFHTRCPVAKEICQVQSPELKPHTTPDHQVACHFAGEINLLKH